MTQYVSNKDLLNSSWETHVEYSPSNRPLPGICTLVCADYPVTYRFYWQILRTLSDDGTQWEAYVDATDIGDRLEAKGIRVDMDEYYDRGDSDVVDSDELGLTLREDFGWMKAVLEAYPQRLAPIPVELEPFTLENDHGANKRFTGEEITSVTSRKIDGPGSQRWTELTLYRTKGGTLVCHEIGQSLWQGEETRYTVYVAQDEADLISQVGLGSLAKDLYDGAGIDHTEEID